MADYLIGANQKIPDSPMKTTFPGKSETAIRLGSKPWFGDVGLIQVTLSGAHGFLFNSSTASEKTFTSERIVRTNTSLILH